MRGCRGFHSEGVYIWGFKVRRCRGFHSEGVEGFIVRGCIYGVS